MSERSRFAVSSKMLFGACLPRGPRKGDRPVESNRKDPGGRVGKGDSRSNGITRRPQGGRRVSPTSRPKTLPAQSNQRAEPSQARRTRNSTGFSAGAPIQQSNEGVCQSPSPPGLTRQNRLDFRVFLHSAGDPKTGFPTKLAFSFPHSLNCIAFFKGF